MKNLRYFLCLGVPTSSSPQVLPAPSSNRFLAISELVDIFLEYLDRDDDPQSSLRNCSLVCRCWTFLAQTRLFRDVVLRAHSRSIFVDFHKFLLSSPHIGAMIHSLRLNGSIYDPSSTQLEVGDRHAALPLSTLKASLQKLPKLQVLSLTSILFEKSESPSDSMNNHLVELDTLVIDSLVARKYESFQAVVDVFQLFSSINCCRISGISSESDAFGLLQHGRHPEQQPPYVFPNNVRITTLQINYTSFHNEVLDGLFNGMCRSTSFVNSIQSFDVHSISYGITSHNIETYENFFKSIGPRLRTLKMDLSDFCMPNSALPPDLVGNRLYLNRFSSLKKIHVKINLGYYGFRAHIPVCHSPRIFDLLGGVFSEIPPDTLHSITLDCEWSCESEVLRDSIKDCNWEPFRTALVNMTRLEVLEVDRFIFERGGSILSLTRGECCATLDWEVREVFEDRLPELAQQGILQFPIR